LECIVFGAKMADIENEILRAEPVVEEKIEESHFTLSNDDWNHQKVQLEEIREKLPRLVWKSAGICREQRVLESAIASIVAWQKQFSSLPLSQFLLSLSPTQSASFNLPDIEQQLRLWAETRNLLDVGYLILTSAAFRTESRGGHYRLDYPETDPNWQVHTIVKNDNWEKSSVCS